MSLFRIQTIVQGCKFIRGTDEAMKVRFSLVNGEMTSWMALL